MAKIKNKNKTSFARIIYPYLLMGFVAYLPWMFVFYAVQFQISFVLKYIGGDQGLLFSTLILISASILVYLLRKKNKYNIYFLTSIILNVGLLSLFVLYYTSPFLDYLVIDRSLPRFCQISDPSINKQCKKLLENWKLPMPLMGSEINSWKSESETLDYVGKIHYRIPPNAEFEKSSHSGHPNFGTLKDTQGFPLCINLSLFSDSSSLDKAIDQGATRWGDSSFLNYEVENEFSDNNIKERIIKRDAGINLDAVVFLGNDLRDSNRKIFLYADECDFSDSQIFRTFIRNFSL